MRPATNKSILIRSRNLWRICMIENIRDSSILIYSLEKSVPTLLVSAILTAIFAPSLNFWILFNCFLYIFIGFSIWNVVSSCFRFNEKKFLRQKNNADKNGLSFQYFLLKYYFDTLFPMISDLVIVALIVLNGVLFQGFWIALPFFGVWFVLFILAMFSMCYLILVLMVFIPSLRYFIDGGIRLAFFATPIFWGFQPSEHGIRQFLEYFNPFSIIMRMPRQAIQAVQWDTSSVFLSYYVLVAFIFVGLLCYKLTFEKFLTVR
jgi:lipopolysaccharide transport system permease protein